VDKKHVFEGILIRVVATVVGTVILVFLFKWFGLGAVAYGGYRRLTRSNN